MTDIDATLHITHTTAFENTVDARRVDTGSATATCAMCGSLVTESFTCSPVKDLGASVSNYTDWHLGNADQACVLCAISNFKTPRVLEPARKLIFQRKLVYFAASTPSARKSDRKPAETPFFTDANFSPRLEIRSLESLVTLHIIAALYLHNVRQQAVHYYDGEPDLWLEESFPIGPFSFAGEVASAKSKAGMPSFIAELYETLKRPIELLDPLMPMKIEVPLHILACLWGVSKGRHYEFKYKPLIVSNETAALPVVWEGYHLINDETVQVLEDLELLLSKTRSASAKANEMRVAALLAGPNDFIEVLVDLGGFNYETIIKRVGELAGCESVQGYLHTLRRKLLQHPLILDLKERKK